MAAVSNQDATLTAAWFESIRDPMMLCNRSLVVTAANRAASELLEIAAGELLQRKVNEILRPIGLAPIFRGPADLQWRCELPAGKGDRRTLDVSGVPFHDRATGAEGWAVSCRSLPAAPEFIGRSAAAQSLRDTVSLLAASHATSILLLGESGAGKELIAKRLHALSKRAAAPLIPINCAALPEALLECELFGYQKGAFTGAQQTKEGLPGSRPWGDRSPR